ncbi:neuropeptide FF receptor 2 [Sphaerodactylus townsendi]|uniref:neuropeptide FF receptor 2 n=1 Tax=Sphaerodactylus townsendi TaxID=933632 RepID=UPI0020270374|nr:neuropeptide FF receptor 2 [Sphaerodactylus townsendi]
MQHAVALARRRRWPAAQGAPSQPASRVPALARAKGASGVGKPPALPHAPVPAQALCTCTDGSRLNSDGCSEIGRWTQERRIRTSPDSLRQSGPLSVSPGVGPTVLGTELRGFRFRSIVYPFKQKLTISTAVVIIAVIWVLAVAIMCPSAVMLKVEKEKHFRVILGDGNETSPIYWCREDWPNQDMRKIYTTVLFANIYLAPLSLIVIMYARIGITLFNTVVPATGKQGHERHSVYKKKQKVVKMLIIVALLFILSWLPLWTLAMLSDYAHLTEEQLQVINIYVYPFAHWLAFFNSSMNPIIYGFFNENFRRGFQAAFRFQLCSGDGMLREIYSQRRQSNAVLPAAVLQQTDQNPTSRLPQKGNWMDKTQVLMLEDLEKAANNNGMKQDLL